MSKRGSKPALSLPLIATPHLSSRTPPRWGVASLDQLCRVREPSIGFTILNLSGRRLVRKLRDDIEFRLLGKESEAPEDESTLTP